MEPQGSVPGQAVYKYLVLGGLKRKRLFFLCFAQKELHFLVSCIIPIMNLIRLFIFEKYQL